MPPPKFDVPQAAKPKHGDYFDPWNSSSTGHQRAENRLGGSKGWRQSRSMKLSHQFKGGASGEKRISDTVGAGAEAWDEKAKALMPKHVQERARNSVKDMLVGSQEDTAHAALETKAVSGQRSQVCGEEKLMTLRREEDDLKENKLNRKKGIFDGLVIYINGSTYPLVSDHKLKHMLAENGARLSIHLGRRTVTHVILGRPSDGGGAGAGGGLSGTKIEKEIRRVGGCGMKYVGVEWALESIKGGKRLPETQFSNLKVAAKAQKSVYGMLKRSNSSSSI